MSPREKPLSVVVAAVIHDGRILLIRRRRGDYVNLWGLPGGKVERDEHLAEAAVREIGEEAGIASRFKAYLGLVSEHLVEGDRVTAHFLLHVCELTPLTTHVANDTEGALAWFPLDGIDEMREAIIPSDYLMLEKIIKGRSGGYYECVLKKVGEHYRCEKFIGGAAGHARGSRR